MTAQIADFTNGLLTVKLAGKLTESSLATLQAAIADHISEHGKLSVLVSAEDFTGWEQGGTWDDFSFQGKYDPYIKRMAIVGDRRWEDLALVFTAKDLRQFPIEYFASSEQAKARAWLLEN